MLSIVQDAWDEMRRVKARIKPPTPETVDSLRSLARDNDPLVENYAAQRIRPLARTIDFNTPSLEDRATELLKGQGDPSMLTRGEQQAAVPGRKPVGMIEDVARAGYDVARKPIPGAERVAKFVGDVAEPVLRGALRLTPAAQPQVTPSGTTEEQKAAASAGADLAESMVPTEVWMAALELVPGVGTVPDLVKLVKKESPEAILALRTALKDERVQPFIRKMAEERGTMKIPGEPTSLTARMTPEQEQAALTGQAENRIKALAGPEGNVPERPASVGDATLPAPETRPLSAQEAAVPPVEARPAEPATGGGEPPVPPKPPTAVSASGELPPDNFDGDVMALTETLRKSKRLRPEQERAFAAERRQRGGRVGGILESGRGEEAFRRARGSLKGEFEGHATFEPPDIPAPRRARMVEEIRTSDKLQPFQKLNAKQAFDKVMAGVLPEPKELEFLERVFGTDFSQAVLDKAPATWAQKLVDVLTLPKAMLASFDLSFPLRQGMILAPSQPKAWLKSWGPMVKAFATESNAKIADDAMQADPLWSRFLDANGYHSPLSGGARAAREESFASRLVEKIPGMRSSQR
ncbi:MAG: hypothetical protein NUW01_13230, partial [Gemmatimonadaceae bacterium]|nr:hypothetical protein [Gemmatimonadaceae bacterium]